MKRTVKILSLLAAFLLLAGCAHQPAVTVPATTAPHTEVPTTVPATTVVPQTRPVVTAPTTPDPTVTEPAAESFVLSFAGDCTFGDNFGSEEETGTFCKVVKDKYGYPLSNVRDYFLGDDLTLVNLECALTASDPTEEEMETLKENLFRFRGPVEYTNILLEGGVEFASCANNHSRDYGQQGLKDTWAALEEAEIAYASFGKSTVVETQRGLKVGIFTVFFNTTESSVKMVVDSLKSRGAQLIIMSVHWGDEGTYTPTEQQYSIGHMAIDAGVHIVYGHHSHTLQPIESYHGGIIYYSTGNFSFGGNRNPKDKDTAILQQEVLRYEDGTVALGSLTAIPCRISTSDSWNDYRPTPYEPGSEEYLRCLAKLEGSFEGPAVEVPYLTQPTEPTT